MFVTIPYKHNTYNMKTLIIIILLVPAAGFAQSKKELNAALAMQIATNDSLEFALKQQTAVTDSLKTELALQLKKFGYQLTYTQTLEYNVESIHKKFTECSAENSLLKEELDNCLSKGKPVTPTKPKTPENNPFGGNGGHGSGNGNNFGNDDGIGSGDGEKRYLIAKPDVSEIESEENCTIVFTVMINENGDIVGTPTVIKEKTTTTNTALILKVAQVVKAQAKYNVLKKGSEIVKTPLTIQISAK